ncbi:MAG: LegC family aminotransferase [Bdellovibrionales bacterium]|nr:LegC family aminotransferase [Bdellovibrionales bacterium]
MGIDTQPFLPLCVPSLEGNELKYVTECIETEWVSSVGKYVNQLEEDMARYTGSNFAVAVASGTAALHICLLLSGVQEGDEVIVPTVTFIAPVNAVKYVNAEPIFMDCDDFYNIDVNKVFEFIESETEFREGFSYNKKSGARVSAIVPVHVFGNAIEMSALKKKCDERNIKIIEDATESLGTRYCSGVYAGQHTGLVGDFGCISFNGNKIMTTGGGGMILTNNEQLAKKAKYLTTQAKDDEIAYIHNEIGYNYRLTNVQAAIGVAQLEQMPKFVESKQRNFYYLKSRIDEIEGLHLLEGPDYAENNYWMYGLVIDSQAYGLSRDELLMAMGNMNIQCRPIWYLNHLQKPYVNSFSYKIERAFQAYERTLNIPCSTKLTESECDRVVLALEKLRKC